MNRKKHISKKLLSRLLMFLVVTFAAVLFDAFHEGPDQLAQTNHQHSDTTDLEASQVFFFNPINSFKLRTGVNKLFTGFLIADSQNQFLAQYHNLRSFHLLKAESLKDHPSFIQMAHFMKFNSCHRLSPDDKAAFIG